MAKSDLFHALGEILQDQINANVYEKRWHRSRVQARNRPSGSRDLDYTPFEEVRDQDHDEMRSDDSR